MAQFVYKAMDPGGNLVTGTSEALNELELEQLLKASSLDLISAKHRKQSAFSRRSKMTRRDLIVLYIDLEQMTHAGIPVVDALIELRDSMEASRSQEVLSGLLRNIEQGMTISEAMAQFPDEFNEMTIKLVASGEKTGELEQVFKELKETTRWQDDLIRTTKKLMAYPLFVGLVMFGVICFLMVYLVPQLIQFITSMEQEIPLHTKALIAVSDFFVDYWLAILFAPPALFFFIKLVLKNNRNARFWFDFHQLSIPMLGETLKKIMLARFSRNFAMLYESGIDVVECVKISQQTVTNLYLKKALSQISQAIEEGRNLHQAFSSADLFPPLVLRMINVGEQTGEIGKAILNVSLFYTNDVNDAIGKIQSLIEPVMTVFMGLILGWIMLSVLGPIYDLVSNIQM